MVRAKRNLIKLSQAPVEVVDVLAVFVIASVLHYGSLCDVLRQAKREIHSIMHAKSHQIHFSITHLGPFLCES
jgi:hypothetical protein